MMARASLRSTVAPATTRIAARPVAVKMAARPRPIVSRRAVVVRAAADGGAAADPYKVMIIAVSFGNAGNDASEMHPGSVLSVLVLQDDERKLLRLRLLLLLSTNCRSWG